jgi:hypothetical protein
MSSSSSHDVDMKVVFSDADFIDIMNKWFTVLKDTQSRFEKETVLKQSIAHKVDFAFLCAKEFTANLRVTVHSNVKASMDLAQNTAEANKETPELLIINTQLAEQWREYRLRVRYGGRAFFEKYSTSHPNLCAEYLDEINWLEITNSQMLQKNNISVSMDGLDLLSDVAANLFQLGHMRPDEIVNAKPPESSFRTDTMQMIRKLSPVPFTLDQLDQLHVQFQSLLKATDDNLKQQVDTQEHRIRKNKALGANLNTNRAWWEDNVRNFGRSLTVSRHAATRRNPTNEFNGLMDELKDGPFVKYSVQQHVNMIWPTQLVNVIRKGGKETLDIDQVEVQFREARVKKQAALDNMLDVAKYKTERSSLGPFFARAIRNQTTVALRSRVKHIRDKITDIMREEAADESRVAIPAKMHELMAALERIIGGIKVETTAEIEADYTDARENFMFNLHLLCKMDAWSINWNKLKIVSTMKVEGETADEQYNATTINITNEMVKFALTPAYENKVKAKLLETREKLKAFEQALAFDIFRNELSAPGESTFWLSNETRTRFNLADDQVSRSFNEVSSEFANLLQSMTRDVHQESLGCARSVSFHALQVAVQGLMDPLGKVHTPLTPECVNMWSSTLFSFVDKISIDDTIRFLTTDRDPIMQQNIPLEHFFLQPRSVAEVAETYIFLMFTQIVSNLNDRLLQNQ